MFVDRKLYQLLKEFIKTEDLKSLPESEGVYLIADCPLEKTNPSKWNCSPLKIGSAKNLKNEITGLAASLAGENKNLTYFYFQDHRSDRYQDFLKHISQARTHGT